MVTKWINDASDPPTIVFCHCPHLPCARGDRTSEGRIRIRYRHHHPHGSASQRFRTKVAVFGRFVCDPELRACNSQLRDHRSCGIVKLVEYFRSECLPVEFHGLCSTPDRQHRCNRNCRGRHTREGIQCRDGAGGGAIRIAERCIDLPDATDSGYGCINGGLCDSGCEGSSARRRSRWSRRG